MQIRADQKRVSSSQDMAEQIKGRLDQFIIYSYANLLTSLIASKLILTS